MFIKIHSYEEALEYINNIRKSNKEKWYQGRFEYRNKYYISFKGFGTWLQIFRVEHLEDNKLLYNSDIMANNSVKMFNHLLTQEFISLDTFK